MRHCTNTSDAHRFRKSQCAGNRERVRPQAFWHVWKHHTKLWEGLFAEVTARLGGDPSGPPDDLPRRLLVRVRVLLGRTTGRNVTGG